MTAPRRTPSAVEQALMDGLAGPLEAAGLDLEEVRISKAGRRDLVRVAVDRDGGVDLDAVAEASRLVSDLLDSDPLAQHLPGPFVLEVTSPGVDRPLTQVRHWRRAVGRLVDATLTDGSTVAGRIVRIDGDDVAAVAVWSVDGAERTVPVADVAKAIVQVEFGAIPDAAADEQE